MLKDINHDLSNELIDTTFQLIDANSSNYISLKEFQNYYNKVNSIVDNISE
jgi:Ca2+-binding EF-hand superfamily protein